MAAGEPCLRLLVAEQVAAHASDLIAGLSDQSLWTIHVV